ncbi:MAG: hypothetical protein LH645_14230 [Actinomycetia bacterium]|nr:hypothetical protein [Actinomycetes bacterium]
MTTATAAWADLSPDSDFGGGDGFVTADFSIADDGLAVATSDTRIYAVQEEGNDVVRVLAYTLGGDLDTTYGGGDGIAPVTLLTVGDIELLPSGKILLAGQRTSNTPGRVIRLTADGAPDTTFSGDGVISLPYEMQGLAIDSQGRIVAGGSLVRASSPGYRKSDFAVARIRSNGTLDPNFSGDGKATVSSGLVDNVSDVAVDSADRPIVVGTTSDGVYSMLWSGLIARFKAGGAIDTAFSGDGLATANLSKGQNTANAVGVGANDRVVVAMSNQEKFGGVRFLANGSLDSNYSADGKVSAAHGGSVYGAAVIAGAIYVTGASGAGFDQVLVGGVTTSGELNGAFGAGGKNSYNFSADEDFGEAVTLDGAGRVVVVGLTANGVNNNLLVARLLLP